MGTHTRSLTMCEDDAKDRSKQKVPLIVLSIFTMMCGITLLGVGAKACSYTSSHCLGSPWAGACVFVVGVISLINGLMPNSFGLRLTHLILGIIVAIMASIGATIDGIGSSVVRDFSSCHSFGTSEVQGTYWTFDREAKCCSLRRSGYSDTRPDESYPGCFPLSSSFPFERSSNDCYCCSRQDSYSYKDVDDCDDIPNGYADMLAATTALNVLSFILLVSTMAVACCCCTEEQFEGGGQAGVNAVAVVAN